MKYKIRRAILMALANGDTIVDNNQLLNHPLLLALNVEAEAIRDQIKLLVQHGYLIQSHPDLGLIALSFKEFQNIHRTLLPSRDEFLWGSIVAPSVKVRKKGENTMIGKEVFYNIALSAMIRDFVGAKVGTGYALAIDRVLEETRPKAVEEIPITYSEAAMIASTVINRVENDC